MEATGKIKPGGPPEVPPGIRRLFARYASIYFEETQGERDVFAAELYTRLNAGEVLLVVDVRDPASYQGGHIASAVNIPIEDLFLDEVQAELPLDGTPIVLVGANGQVSSMAAGVLGTMGYNVYALRFGMIGWNRSTLVQVYSNQQYPQGIHGLGGPLSY